MGDTTNERLFDNEDFGDNSENELESLRTNREIFWRNLALSIKGEIGAGRSSEVELSLIVRWVVGSILHGEDPLSYFSFQPVLHDWCNKCRGMCHPLNR